MIRYMTGIKWKEAISSQEFLIECVWIERFVIKNTKKKIAVVWSREKRYEGWLVVV